MTILTVLVTVTHLQTISAEEKAAQTDGHDETRTAATTQLGGG